MKGVSSIPRSTATVTVAVTFTILAAFGNTEVFATGIDRRAPVDTFDAGEAVYMNFIKVLAGVLITTPAPPIPILDSVKTVMRETMNTQGNNENFLYFLVTEMPQLESKLLTVQVNRMLEFMSKLPKEAQLSQAASILKSFLNSSDGSKVYTDIENYVTSLFQSVITTPMIDSAGEAVSSLGRIRPANTHNHHLNGNNINAPRRTKLF